MTIFCVPKKYFCKELVINQNKQAHEKNHIIQWIIDPYYFILRM